MNERTLNLQRAAARRRPFDELERRLVELTVAAPRGPRVRHRVEQLRYALSFAKLTLVEADDGSVFDLAGVQGLHARRILQQLAPHLDPKRGSLDGALRAWEPVIRSTLRARKSLLSQMSLDRDALEREVTERHLVIASGGGGGAGYVYPGVYDMVDRIGVTPSLLVGTSIGALLSMFRARRRRFDLAALVAAARALSWSKVFRVLETESRYGLPATLRLYLRAALGHLFQTEGRSMWLSDMAIPLYIVATGITVHALKHDLHYYERLIEADVRTSSTMRARAGLRAMHVLREFLAAPEALRQVVLGRDPGTQDFDVLDAAGFSAAIPGVIHYDVLRDDSRMHRILDELYAAYGITRLGEGGMVANVPARIAWTSALSGRLGPLRNAFVLALDCFAPSRTRLQWYPFQQLVYNANVAKDMAFSDLTINFRRTLSPLNLVPPVQDAMQAIRYGREATRPHMPFLREILRPIPVLRDRDAPSRD